MRFICFCIFSLISISVFSQQTPSNLNAAGQDRIAQIKIAKLSGDMRLTKSQAQKFWPIYNSFDAQRRDIRREIRGLSRIFSEDDDAYKKQERIQDLKQKELDITRKYKFEFLKVITEQQYGIMLTSEERFNQALLEQLKQRNRD